MVGAIDEQDVLNSITRLHLNGTHNRARYHEHHGYADEHVVINPVAPLAIKRRSAAGHVRSGRGQNECGGRTKSAADFFPR